MCKHKNINKTANIFWLMINGAMVVITHCPWCGKELRKEQHA